MLKKLIGAVYLLTTSSLSIATGISTMTGNALLSDTATNWDPAFVDGNTVVVGADNIELVTNVSKTIGAIRLDHTLSMLGYYSNSTASPTIGSIAGKSKLKRLKTAGPLKGQIWTFTGTAGVDNNPPANDYSGVSNIHFTYTSILNINAPVTINSTFSSNIYRGSTININDNVILTHNSIASINNTFNIAASKSLTLSGSGMTLTSVFDFSDSGKLILSGDNTIFNPSLISNASSAVLNVDNNVTTSMPSVLTINTINIADGKSLTIDAVNSDIDLLDDNASINFSGSNATLVLTNSGASDRTFTAYNTVTGDVLFSSDGSLVADKGVAGSITTSADNIGTITIDDGNVGVVGATDKKLKQVNLNQDTAASVGQLYAGNVDIGGIGPITATDLLTSELSFSSNGTLISDGGITGNVDFAGNEGVLQLADGKTITGDIDSSGTSAGTLEFLGVGTVNGSIGATNALTTLKFTGAGDNTIPAANAKTIEVANAAASVTASALLTGDVLFSQAGTLATQKGIIGNVTFNDAGTLVTAGISGNIDCQSQAATINFSGDKAYILKSPIQNAENATLDVNLPKLTTIDLEVGSINISDNKILAIDLASGNKTLLAPGGNGIKFLGANSTFQIENTSSNDARVASFAANLAGDTGGGGYYCLAVVLKG